MPARSMSLDHSARAVSRCAAGLHHRIPANAAPHDIEAVVHGSSRPRHSTDGGLFRDFGLQYVSRYSGFASASGARYLWTRGRDEAPCTRARQPLPFGR